MLNLKVIGGFFVVRWWKTSNQKPKTNHQSNFKNLQLSTTKVVNVIQAFTKSAISNK